MSAQTFAVSPPEHEQLAGLTHPAESPDVAEMRARAREATPIPSWPAHPTGEL